MAVLLVAAALGDKGPNPDQSYGAPQQQVKYGGPIVYSGEKPPIIHFPPPPAPSHSNGGYGNYRGGNGNEAPPAIKYVPDRKSVV